MPAQEAFRQAAEAYRSGNFSMAVSLCDELLLEDQSEPNQAALLNLKALSLAGLGLMFDALDCAEKAVRIQPGDALLWHHSARLLLELGRNEAARDAAGKACELQPNNLSLLYHQAVIFLRQRDFEQAATAALQCIRQDSSFAEARILLSEIELSRGNTAQAMNQLKEVVSQNPLHDRAWGLLADLQNNDEDRVLIRQSLESILTGDVPLEAIATAEFALGNLDRREGLYQSAFAHYKRANQITAEGGSFDIQNWQKRVEQALACAESEIEPQRPASLGNSAGQGENLLFIVGMPRSGTSLTEQILSSHPGVFALGENPVMEYIEKDLRQKHGLKNGAKPFAALNDSGFADAMRKRYLDSLPPGSDKYQKITDKAPRNFERLDLIFELFPKARVLWCTRHPLDTILSCYFQDFGAAQQFSTSLMACAQVFAGQVKLMQHFMNCFGPSIDLIDYAMLVQNLEASVREMAEFAGLDFHPAMLEPHRNQRLIRTASSSQVKRPVYTSSINNWRHYPEELAQVRAWLEQQGLLDHLGRSRLVPV